MRKLVLFLLMIIPIVGISQEFLVGNTYAEVHKHHNYKGVLQDDVYIINCFRDEPCDFKTYRFDENLICIKQSIVYKKSLTPAVIQTLNEDEGLINISPYVWMYLDVDANIVLVTISVTSNYCFFNQEYYK